MLTYSLEYNFSNQTSYDPYEIVTHASIYPNEGAIGEMLTITRTVWNGGYGHESIMVNGEEVIGDATISGSTITYIPESPGSLVYTSWYDGFKDSAEALIPTEVEVFPKILKAYSYSWSGQNDSNYTLPNATLIITRTQYFEIGYGDEQLTLNGASVFHEAIDNLDGTYTYTPTETGELIYTSTTPALATPQDTTIDILTVDEYSVLNTVDLISRTDFSDITTYDFLGDTKIWKIDSTDGYSSFYRSFNFNTASYPTMEGYYAPKPESYGMSTRDVSGGGTDAIQTNNTVNGLSIIMKKNSDSTKPFMKAIDGSYTVYLNPTVQVHVSNGDILDFGPMPDNWCLFEITPPLNNTNKGFGTYNFSVRINDNLQTLPMSSHVNIGTVNLMIGGDDVASIACDIHNIYVNLAANAYFLSDANPFFLNEANELNVLQNIYMSEFPKITQPNLFVPNAFIRRAKWNDVYGVETITFNGLPITPNTNPDGSYSYYVLEDGILEYSSTDGVHTETVSLYVYNNSELDSDIYIDENTTTNTGTGSFTSLTADGDLSLIFNVTNNYGSNPVMEVDGIQFDFHYLSNNTLTTNQNIDVLFNIDNPTNAMTIFSTTDITVSSTANQYEYQVVTPSATHVFETDKSNLGVSLDNDILTVVHGDGYWETISSPFVTVNTSSMRIGDSDMKLKKLAITME